MKILGFSAFFHDAAAALVIDNQIVAAAEEERFIREKHTGKFPINAIKFCLKEGGIEPEELDVVAYFIAAGENTPQNIRALLGSFYAWFKGNRFSIPSAISWAMPNRNTLLGRSNIKAQSFAKNIVSWPRLFRVKFGLDNRSKPKMVGVPHHLAHIGSSYLLSGFDEGAILIADQRGETTTTTLAARENGALEILKSIALPDSLGSLYGAVTEFLGFEALSGEGKVMGLSSYGHPTYRKQFEQFLKIQPDGLFKLNLDYVDFTLAINAHRFPPGMIRELGPPRDPRGNLEPRHKDIALSLQERLEVAMLSLLEHLEDRVKPNRLVLGGGVALNSVANGRIIREAQRWSDVFVPSAPGDAGAALGAAVWTASQANGSHPFKKMSPYLGPSYSNQECEAALMAAGLDFRKCSNVAEIAAKLLSQGMIIGWFQGRMEFGPRALGNRSLLADPRTAEMRDRVNTVKNRELWRPLAPSFLAEEASAWFEEPGESPFMSFVKTVGIEKRSQIAACVHVDGTARLQTVSFRDNPRYWQLIKYFQKLTGVPCILNTSFNQRGEPIVCTPNHAIRSFLNMSLDFLFLNDFIAAKPGSSLKLPQ